MNHAMTPLQPGTRPLYEIVGRKKGKITSPSDLSNFSLRALPEDAAETEPVFMPYAVSRHGNCVVEVDCPDLSATKKSPFFYISQYESASRVRLTELSDYIAINDGDQSPSRKVFVFSIGRAGSTLVSKILDAGGVPSISEPDALLDLSRTQAWKGFDDGMLSQLYRSCLSELEKGHGSPETLAVKYRAQSSNTGHVKRVMDLYPDARILFLFRDVSQWAKSFTKNFQFNSDTLKWVLTENLKSAEMAIKSGADVEVLDYDLITRSPEVVLRNIDGVRSDIDLSGVLSEDSQDGMFGRRDPSALKTPGDESAEYDRFMDWWKSERPTDRLERLGLAI